MTWVAPDNFLLLPNFRISWSTDTTGHFFTDPSFPSKIHAFWSVFSCFPVSFNIISSSNKIGWADFQVISIMNASCTPFMIWNLISKPEKSSFYMPGFQPLLNIISHKWRLPYENLRENIPQPKQALNILELDVRGHSSFYITVKICGVSAYDISQVLSSETQCH